MAGLTDTQAQAIITELQNLNRNTVAASGGPDIGAASSFRTGRGGGGSATSQVDAIKFELASKNVNSAAKEMGKITKQTTISSKDLRVYQELSAKHLESAVHGLDNMEELARYEARIAKQAEKAGMSSLVTNLETLIEQQKQGEERQELMDRLEQLSASDNRVDAASQQALTNEIESLKDRAEELGMPFDELIDVTETQTVAIEDADGTRRTVNKNLKLNTNAVNELKKAELNASMTRKNIGKGGSKGAWSMIKGATKGLYDIGKGALLDVTKLVDGARSMQEFGMGGQETATAQWISWSTQMGMSIDTMAEFQAANKQAALGMGGVENYFDMINENTGVLNQYTKDNAQAARASVAFADSLSAMGVPAEDMEAALKKQNQAYIDNGRIVGQTTDQYAQQMKILQEDAGIKEMMLGLDRKDRANAFLGIQARVKEIQALGHTAESAMGVVQYFSQMKKKSPKEVMKEAMRARMMAGAVGMGDEGARMQELQMKVAQGGPGGQEAMTELTALRGQMEERIAQAKASGTAGWLLVGSLQEKAGIEVGLMASLNEAKSFDETQAKKETERWNTTSKAQSEALSIAVQTRTGIENFEQSALVMAMGVGKGIEDAIRHPEKEAQGFLGKFGEWMSSGGGGGFSGFFDVGGSGGKGGGRSTVDTVVAQNMGMTEEKATEMIAASKEAGGGNAAKEKEIFKEALSSFTKEQGILADKREREVKQREEKKEKLVKDRYTASAENQKIMLEITKSNMSRDEKKIKLQEETVRYTKELAEISKKSRMAPASIKSSGVALKSGV